MDEAAFSADLKSDSNELENLRPHRHRALRKDNNFF